MSRSRYAAGLNPRPGDLVTHRDPGCGGLGIIIAVYPWQTRDTRIAAVLWARPPNFGRRVHPPPLEEHRGVNSLECIRSVRESYRGH